MGTARIWGASDSRETACKVLRVGGEFPIVLQTPPKELAFPTLPRGDNSRGKAQNGRGDSSVDGYALDRGPVRLEFVVRAALELDQVLAVGDCAHANTLC